MNLDQDLRVYCEGIVAREDVCVLKRKGGYLVRERVFCLPGKGVRIERKGGYLIRERVFCLPGKGVRGCVCTRKEGWIPFKGKGVLFTR